MRHDSQSCLVANAIPGDRIAYRVTEKRRGVWRGRLDSVISPSPDRVPPPCSSAEACGGCALQPLAFKAHACVKSAWVRDAFSPFINENTAWIGVEEGASPALRRRARWWRGSDDQGIYLGFRARASHAVIRQQRCMVVRPEMDMICRTIETLLPQSVTSLQVTTLSDGMHLVMEGEAGALPDMPASLYSAVDARLSNTRVQWWWRTPEGIHPLRRPMEALHDRLPSGDGMIDLVIGPDDFVQGSEEGNHAMVRQVQQWAKGARRIVDLFSGAGNLSLPLACSNSAISVHGADIGTASVRHANTNAKRLGVDAQYQQANLFGSIDETPFSGADLLILDPPRKGARRICTRMTSLLPARIIMINCDVASGARDAADLHKAGYRLSALRGFDLFPYAGHVEAMSLWER